MGASCPAPMGLRHDNSFKSARFCSRPPRIWTGPYPAGAGHRDESQPTGYGHSLPNCQRGMNRLGNGQRLRRIACDSGLGARCRVQRRSLQSLESSVRAYQMQGSEVATRPWEVQYRPKYRLVDIGSEVDTLTLSITPESKSSWVQSEESGCGLRFSVPSSRLRPKSALRETTGGCKPPGLRHFCA